ncbi:hypothetical protein Mapa_004636 [Marchantia paleacea]|nr:hypothetical protein Mapa_004636 [Marchantia paleacea]
MWAQLSHTSSSFLCMSFSSDAQSYRKKLMIHLCYTELGLSSQDGQAVKKPVSAQCLVPFGTTVATLKCHAPERRMGSDLLMRKISELERSRTTRSHRITVIGAHQRPSVTSNYSTVLVVQLLCEAASLY